MREKISEFFNRSNSVRGASIILVITLTLSNVLGLLRDHFLAGKIPTSELDIYFAAFRIPDLIFNFLVLGAISSAFIPVFCEFIESKKMDEGWRVTNTLLNLSVVTLIIFAIIMYFVMPFATPLVVPDFPVEKMEKVTELSRLLMLTPIFFSISYILSGVLNSYKKFISYSIAPLVYNLSIIVGILLVGKSTGILGIVYFVILGSILHFLVQLPTTIKCGFKYQLLLNYKNSSIIKILKLMVPRTIGMGVNQIMLLVFTAIASTLAIGSISAFNFANNIQTMPVVVFGTSFATAVFPTLTRAIAAKKHSEFSFYLNRSIRAIAFILIPISALFILMRAQIIRLILGSGEFEWSDTRATALVLGFFSISLFAQGAIPLLARAFYALKNTKTPMYISIITALLSIILGFIFSKSMGVSGLALAFTLGSFFNALLLYFLLSRAYHFSLEPKFIFFILKITLVSFIAALFTWFTLHLAAQIVNMATFWGVLEQVIIASFVGIFIYISISYIMRFDEMKWAIRRKINGSN